MKKKISLKKYLWIDDVFRTRSPLKTRFNKLRLDKNERLLPLEKKWYH